MMNMRLPKSRAVALAVALAVCGFSAAARAADGAMDHAALDAALESLVKGFYGTFDVSIDDSTKGMGGMKAYHINAAGTGLDYTNPKGAFVPFGPVGYQAAISTNASGLGWRGTHAIPGTADTQFLIQIEAAVGITASPGVVTSYTAQTNGVSGAIGLGTTYVGFGSKEWGAIKVGHGTTPYKKSTDRLDPFAGMVGDMPVIMGNTGGDNRVEFNATMDHAIWFESAKYSGFSFDAMFSPGQNRTPDSVGISAGSSNCNGGNVPGSGNLLLDCDDGGFDNAYSLAFKFETKQLYLVAAYELHKNVNRNSDGIGSNAPAYGTMMGLGDPAAGSPGSPYLNWALYDFVGTAYGATGSCATAPSSSTYYCANATPEFVGDIGDEAAYKFGAQYLSDFGLTVSAIVERMTRKIPAALAFQNERQRNGWWLALTQELGPNDNVNFGWAHAGKTPGDPGGQHNFDPGQLKRHRRHVHVRRSSTGSTSNCTCTPTWRRPSTTAMRTTTWAAEGTASRPTATTARPRRSSTTRARATPPGAGAIRRRCRSA